MTMRRPAAAVPVPLLLLLAAFALAGVGGSLLLLEVPLQQGRRLGPAAAAENSKVRLGSRPPSCGGKCDECSPCTAVQVPTPTALTANYKPVGWKCQCRHRLYQP